MSDVSFLPPNASLHFFVIMIATFGFWLAAYVLIIRKSFAEKSFGMPVAALCCNMAWELLLSTVYASPYLLIHLGNILWLLFDVGILVAVLKYGRREFEPTSLAGRYLPFCVLGGILMAVIVQGVFMREFNDLKGFITGWACALLMSALFIAMHERRKTLLGQSFGIAACMLLGNVCALLWILTEPGAGPVGHTTLALVVCTLTLNALYAARIAWTPAPAQVAA